MVFIIKEWLKIINFNSNTIILSYDVLADCHPDLEVVNLSGSEISPGVAFANFM